MHEAVHGAVRADEFSQTPLLAQMSYATQSTSYREMEVLSASPERLLLIVLDQLVVNLERARIAMERGDIELRVVSLRRSRSIVAELLATLDFDKGGRIATQLADLYQFMLVELTDVGQRGDVRVVRKLVTIATSLREGFAGAATQAVAMPRSA